jgi:uncharacterized protein YraI
MLRDILAVLVAVATMATLGPASAQQAGQYRVANLKPGDTLNVRAGASSGAQILVKLDRGTIVNNLGCRVNGKTRWCQITQTSGPRFRGWASAAYLKALTGAVPGYPPPSHLPDPIVSRALDAVLLPVNNAVRRHFGLGPRTKGLYVLAVMPGGVADSFDIRPGDVLGSLFNRPILRPVDVDAWVWEGLNDRRADFSFGIDRGSRPLIVTTNITVNNYENRIDFNEFNSWSAVDTEDWSGYVTDYSTTLVDSFDVAAPDSIESYAAEQPDPPDDGEGAMAPGPDAPDDGGGAMAPMMDAPDDGAGAMGAVMPDAPDDGQGAMDVAAPDAPDDGEGAMSVDAVDEAPPAEEDPNQGYDESSPVPGADMNGVEYQDDGQGAAGVTCDDGTVVADLSMCPVADEAAD